MNAGTTSVPDVLVVGAGPAGLSCAIAAASRGLQVELVDALKPPIDKACGEGLMPDSLEALASLGLNLKRHLTSLETALVRGIRFVGDQTSSHHFTTAEATFSEGRGRGIRRIVLHQLLLNHAITLGVRFHWGTVVRGASQTVREAHIRTNRGQISARYLVGADGQQSRIANWANLTKAKTYSRRIGLRQHYAIAPWTDFVEVYWSDIGQAYVTPVSGNEVCIAFVSDEKLASAEQGLGYFPTLASHLASARPHGAPRGSVTLGRNLDRVTSGRIALIGDASGSVDAVTGEGMALCFRQAAALALALQANDLAAYQTAHRRIQRLPGLMSRSLLLMDRYPLLRTRTLNAFERNPGLFDRLLRVHIGHSPIRVFGLEGLLATGLHILSN